MATIAKKNDVYREVEETFGRVPEWFKLMPESSVGHFWGLMRDFYLADTKIPGKYKELIGIAVSGATRCRYCALFHTEGARLQGATDEEIAEASMMASFTMCGSTFLNAEQVDYEAFRDETLAIIDFLKSQQAQQAAPATKNTTIHA